MATGFPTSIDSYTDKSGSDIVPSAGWNNMQDAIEALEAKVGVNTSAVSSSLDYKVCNASSADPGHTHSLNTGGNDVTMPAAQVNLGIIKSMRLKYTATSATVGTLEVSSISSGDTIGSQAVTESYSGTNYSVSAAASACVFTIKDSAIAGTVRKVITVVPVVPLTFGAVDATATISGSDILIHISSLTTGQSTANVLVGVWGQSYKFGIWDILYIAY
jgi:hypothetical protein